MGLSSGLPTVGWHDPSNMEVGLAYRQEHKLYAKGMGPVLTLTVSGGSSRAELVRVVNNRR